jgi:F-type H+-transporting ATPase subunit a
MFAWTARKTRVRGDDLKEYNTRGRVPQMFETMAVFIRDEVAKPNLGPLTDKYIPYVWTIFFLILFANVLGLIPIGYALYAATGEYSLSHFGGTATATLSLNAMLAMMSFAMVIFVGIREAGTKDFFNHFNPVGWEGIGNKLVLGPMLFLLEWMGLIIKCAVLAMRLFGTMMAGHVAVGAIIGLIYLAGQTSAVLGYGVGIGVVLLNSALMLLELFIAMLQAFIFTFLTVLFIAAGAVHHDEEHAHEQEHEPEYEEPEVRANVVGAGGSGF